MDFLSLANLSKGFRTNNGSLRSVINNITINVKQGEFVSLFGPNGCGKSTLLFLIAGVEEPDAGTIILNGSSVENSRIGMVFQNYRDALLPWRTNLANLCLPLELDSVPEADRRKKGLRLAKDLGIEIDMRAYPYQMSGGQQQLLSLARSLISGPDLLLLDEPLSSLDFQTGLRMADKIQDIWRRTGITTILVSHDIEDAIYLSDRIFFLTEGPATVFRELVIPLPRPRSPETRTTKEFFDLRNQSMAIFEGIVRVD